MQSQRALYGAPFSFRGMIPKSGNRFAAFAKPAAAGEGRSGKILPKTLDGEKHHDDGGRGYGKRHQGLPMMPRPIGAGLAPHLDHFGLVFIRRRIGAGQSQARAGLPRTLRPTRSLHFGFAAADG